MKLYIKIMIALILGVATGIILGPKAEILKPIGTIFLSLITMIIIPLVFSSMTLGIASIHDPKKLGRVGLKTLIYYLGTTVISILFGLAIATFFEPGQGMNLVSTTPTMALVPEVPNLAEMLLSVIPVNPFASLVNGNVLQILVFSIFVGLGVSYVGEKAKPFLNWVEALAEVMYKITSMVMEFSPYGVFAIMASVSGSFGIAILLPLTKLMTYYYLGIIFHMILIFGGILFFIARMNPLPFFKGMREAILLAFSTGSSSATLPVSMHCANKNLGVSNNLSSFILPLGCTVNMNGTAMFQAMSALFIAQAYGIQLDFYSITSIVFTATLSSIGAAGIPGAGFIMLTAVLASAGLPIEGLAILAGIDRIRDMIGTVANILGDAVVAVAVAKSEGELDEALYNHENVVVYQENEA